MFYLAYKGPHREQPRYKIRWTFLFCIVLTLFFVPYVSAQNDGKNENRIDNYFTVAEVSRILLQGPWPALTQDNLPADPGNELSGNKIAEQLGRQLFHDTDLSGDRTLSCASCHLPESGFADHLPVAQGKQTHTRNSQGLLNVGLQRWFGWDGGADSLWAATLRPMLSAIEMDSDIHELATRLRKNELVFNELTKLANDEPEETGTFSDEDIVVLAAKAIAAYTRTLQSPTTAFDHYREALQSGETAALERYSDSAKRGLKIFIGEANCQVCHFGPNFSNGEFHDIGRPFFTGVGKVDPGRYSGIKRVQQDPYNLTGRFASNASENDKRKTATLKLGQVNFGQWKTPSLRNLTLTAPYMHDGSLASLAEVVEAYANIDPARLHAQGESLLKPLDLSDDQKNDLIVFLESLSPLKN